MIRRALVAVAVGAVVLAVAAPAGAHITVEPSQAPKGSDAVLAFTVPNELENANTVRVEITFPTDHPIADASVEPLAGWTATVQRTKAPKPIQTDNGDVTEMVQSVTWSGGEIKPGEFQEFKVSVGLPSDADSLEFKAVQTYSNGQIVRWIEDSPPNGPEPDNPAPVLTLTGEEATGTTKPAAATKIDNEDSTARTIGIIGIVVGAIGLVVAGVALASRRRGTPGAA
jgi:uncharacterized protein YcnI